MPEYLFKVDTTNMNNFLTKEYGTVIPAGAIVTYEKTPDRIKQLEKIGVVEKVDVDKAKTAKDTQNDDKTPENPILSLNAKDAVDKINDGQLTIEQLQELYELESGDKNRSTVLKEIESEIQDIEEAKKDDQDGSDNGDGGEKSGPDNGGADTTKAGESTK